MDFAEQKLILFYDADCGFCQRSVSWLSKQLSPQILSALAYQTPELAVTYPELDLSHRERGVQLIEVGADGQTNWRRDSQAIARCLQLATNRSLRALGGVLSWPLVRELAQFGYRVIAANRHRISQLYGTSCQIGSATHK